MFNLLHSFLTMDIPPMSLYVDDVDKQTVPSCPLYDVLEKFDGRTVQEGRKDRRVYRIKKLPRYLIFHYKRFTKNNFFVEKNSTIINFPLNNLEMKPCTP